jgi:hypothetical protein
LRKSKAADAEYQKQYRARQKSPEAETKLLNAREPQILREVWKRGVAQLKTPIHVKFDGQQFTGEFPGAVPHAMHILSDGRHLEALFDQKRTLQGWMYELLFLAFLGNSKKLKLLRAQKLIPDRLMPAEGNHLSDTPEQARELAKLIGKQKTDQKQEAWGSFKGTKEDVTAYCNSTPTQDEYLSWLELRAQEFVHGRRIETNDNDDD